MSEDIAGRLRQLARDYSEGRLGLLDYRKLRAPLLDFLVAKRAGAEFDEAVTTRPQFTAGPLSAAASPTAAAVPLIPGTPAGTAESGSADETQGGGGAAVADAAQHKVGSRFWTVAAALLALLLIAVLGSRYHWLIR